jgi:glycosyltransferase involved in cell wall biosynthesis
MNDQTGISLVTTCKGRLRYLKESIKTWLELDYDNYDIIVVEYDCPDGTAAFINKNKQAYLKNSKARDIYVVKVENRPYFNLNDARNIGVRHSRAELIFMIDSDMLIKDKRILRKILRRHQQGIVFFSNLPVLDSHYFEAAAFYQVLYHQTVTVPAILPLVSPSVGSSGTACFQKDLWQECGKYNPEINKLGYGCDDIEFYLRYLNGFFYNHFLPRSSADIDTALDEVLSRFSTFNTNTFREMENPDQEKDRFYPLEKETADAKTYTFINHFFRTFDWKGRKVVAAKTKELPPTLPSWFHPWFCYWYGQKLFETGKEKWQESKKYLHRLLQSNKAKPAYLAAAYFYLGEIEKSQGNRAFETFYKKSLALILPKKGKTEKDLYFIASLYKRLRDYKKAKQWFQRILNSERGTYLYPGAYFHLGEMAFFQQQYDQAQTFFKKTLSLTQHHQKAADYIMVIENKKK